MRRFAAQWLGTVSQTSLALSSAFASVAGLPCAEFSDMPGPMFQLQHALDIIQGTGISEALFHTLLDFNDEEEKAHTVQVLGNVSF